MGLLENRSLLLKSNKILKIDHKNKFKDLNYKKINLNESIIIPGLINSHIHLELNWVHKKLREYKNFPEWLNQIIDLKKNNLNKNVIKKSIKDAIISSIKSGVTTIGQISSYNGIDIPIINKYGIRCCYFYEIANSNKDNFIKNLKVIERRLIKKNLISIGIFPHSIYSLDTKIWETIISICKKKGYITSTHLSESRDEVQFIKGNDNKFDNLIFQKLISTPNIYRRKSFSPLKYLKYINFLDLNPTLVHMNNLSNEDKDIVKKNNLRIIICPRSNVFLKEKLPDLEFMLNYDLTGLGTDGLSSNHDLNIINEMYFLYKKAKKLKIRNLKEKILYIATLGGAKCLGIDNQVGSIQENKKADLIGFKITQKNPLNSILYDGGKNINLRMIDGKII